MMQWIRNDLNIGFVKYRWFGFVLSGILVLSGLIAMVQIARGKAKMGVDFSGGTAIEIEFKQALASDALRAALKDPDFEDVSQQSVNEPGRYKYMLRIFAPKIPTASVSARVQEVLKKNLPGNPAVILSSEDVGPSVSAHLRQQALMALFWAMVGILIYVWWRFDFRFSVAASIATIHDMLAVLGIFYFLGYEVNLLLITALLTIAGYSLNDTVVVFDRIRENLRLRRKDEYNHIIDASVNETLSRTIITSLATLFVVAALLFLGGEVLHVFSLAMFLGIIIGTYSSIFIASNIVAEWNLRDPARR